MSLNNIRLTPQLLAGLYENVLIETRAKAAPDAGLQTIGNNEKNILILINHEDITIIPKSDLDFLTSILTACKLRLEDVVILNWNKVEEKSYKELLQQLQTRFILLFEVTPLQFGLPMAFPPFQIQAFDSRQYLYAPSLQKIAAHKGIKTELWNALKKMFLL